MKYLLFLDAWLSEESQEALKRMQMAREIAGRDKEGHWDLDFIQVNVQHDLFNKPTLSGLNHKFYCEGIDSIRKFTRDYLSILD